jgi:hypothetical protein
MISASPMNHRVDRSICIGERGGRSLWNSCPNLRVRKKPTRFNLPLYLEIMGFLKQPTSPESMRPDRTRRWMKSKKRTWIEHQVHHPNSIAGLVTGVLALHFVRRIRYCVSKGIRRSLETCEGEDELKPSFFLLLLEPPLCVRMICASMFFHTLLVATNGW